MAELTGDDIQFPRRQYQNPPIVEAIATVWFTAPMEWNLATPGLLFSALRDTYPAPPQSRNVMEAQLAAEPDSDSANLQVRTGPQMVMFSNQDQSRKLMIGQAQISSHGLPPYEGWESLESRLIDAFDSIAELRPENSISRLGVRYINRVGIPGQEIRPDDYLTMGINTPAGFPGVVSAFLSRYEATYPDRESGIAFTWASTEADANMSAFMLDLDLSWTPPAPIDRGELGQRLRALKEKETVAFESLLKDSMREVFNEVTN